MAATASAIRAGRAFVELFADDRQLVRGLRAAQRRLKAFGDSVTAAGRRLLMLGGTAAVPFAAAVKTFAGFESAMARVKALTNANAADFQRLEQKAKELGAATVFSASQAADAMSFFALAGFEVDQILAAIGPTLDLAASGQIEIAEAADITAKIMAGMGIAASDVANVVDVMTKAMTTANTDMLQLGEAFKFVGPMAKSAGISLEEVTAAIQLLSNAGVQGEMAGTTIRGILLSLTSPSAEAARELKRLGVEVTDQAGNVRSLADIFGQLERATARMGTGEKLRVLGTIFPARQAAGAAELVSQGAEALRQATEALGDSTGTAARIAGTQLDTLQGDFTIFTSALEGVAISVGSALGDALRGGFQFVSRFLSALGTWVEQNKEVVATVAAVVAGILAFGGVLVSTGLAIKLVSFALGGFASVLAAVSAVLGALLSPLGLVISAVGALGTWILTTTDVGREALGWLGEKFGELRDEAVAAWKGIGDALAAGDLALAGKILWLTLRLQFQKGINFLKGLWTRFKFFFLDVWNSAVFKLSEIGINAWAGLQKGWVHAVDFFKDAWLSFTTFVRKAWNSASGFLRKAWAKVKSVVTGESADAEIKKIEADTQAANRRLNEERDRTIFEREQARKSRLGEIEADRQATQDTLGDMQRQQEQQRQQAFDAEMAESEQALDKARAEWQAALDAAAKKRQQAEAQGEDDAPQAKELEQKLQDLKLAGGAVLDADKSSVVGSFSAFAVRGFGSNSAADRTAKATEETAKNTKQLLKKPAPAFT